jgi:hypothetical protein
VKLKEAKTTQEAARHMEMEVEKPGTVPNNPLHPKKDLFYLPPPSLLPKPKSFTLSDSLNLYFYSTK